MTESTKTYSYDTMGDAGELYEDGHSRAHADTSRKVEVTVEDEYGARQPGDGDEAQDKPSIGERAGGLIDGAAERIGKVVNNVKGKMEDSGEKTGSYDGTLRQDDELVDVELDETGEIYDDKQVLDSETVTSQADWEYAQDCRNVQEVSASKRSGTGGLDAHDREADRNFCGTPGMTSEQCSTRINDSYGMRQADREAAMERVDDINRELIDSYDGEVAI